MSRPGTVSVIHKFNLMDYPNDYQTVTLIFRPLGYDNAKVKYKVWYNQPGSNTPKYPLVQISANFIANIQWDP